MGSTTDACALPACFTQLIGACQPEGSCTREIGATQVRLCYDNGVDFVSEITADGAYTITKPDGSTCYRLNLVSGVDFNATYLAPDGTVAGTAQQDVAAGTWTLRCASGTSKVIDSSACGLSADTIPGTGDSSNCTMGSCI